MTQTGYPELTPTQKGALFMGNGAIAFPHNDPDNAVDYTGLTGTLTLDQYIDIVNNATIDLYFRIVATILSGDPSKWSSGSPGTWDIGLVGDGDKSSYCWEPSRDIPTTKTTESLRLYLKAYTDAGYTILYGEDYTDYSFQFFDHTEGALVDWADFENTLDGWARSHANFGTFDVNYPYTGAYSFRLGWSAALDDTYNCANDSSGTLVPNQTYYISKTIDVSGYNTAYLIIHSTRQTAGLAAKSDPKVIRIWTTTKDYLIRINRADDTTQPWRIAIPLPCVSDVIKITAGFSAMIAGAYKNNWIDSVFVVGFT